ncbi:hypothetical protein RNJ44_03108 [Nakaseomyces bracarensis]|uniref:M-phase phosphoprotein 6 n=1 Tax=Nakaseomyces bracarensis TaxID=273131 RepID=A0ABR4NZ80_9SACH
MSGKGELSSRVMNMKFMKFMKTDEEKKADETSESNIKDDDSRWDMKSVQNSVTQSKKLIIRKKPVNVPLEQNVSVTTLENEGKEVKKNALHGRRIFGVNPNKRPAEEDTNSAEQVKTELEDSYNPEEDMDTLLKKSKDTKRKVNKSKAKKHKKK